MMLKFFDIHCSVIFNENSLIIIPKLKKKKLMFFKSVGDIVLVEVSADTQRGWRFDKQLGCQQPCIVFLTPRRIASTLAHQCWLCLSRHRSPITCILLHPSRTFLRLCDIPSPCGCREHVPNPTLPHKGHCGLKNNMSKINNANESIFCTMKTCTLQYKFFWGSN